MGLAGGCGVDGAALNKVTLLDGKTIDPDAYATGWVFWFSFGGFILGVCWILWWTLKHRTVASFAVTNQLSLNDAGEDIGLVTRADQKISNVIAALTAVLLAAGWLYMDRSWPNRIPQ